MTHSRICKALLAALLVCLPLRAATIDELLAKGEEQLSLGKVASADTAFREALRLARETKNRRAEAAARNGIARVFVGNRWEDIGQARIALRIHRELGDSGGEASDLARIGEVYLIHGFTLRALPPLTDAVALYDRLGMQSADEAMARENYGLALQAVGSYEEAVTQLTRALELNARITTDSFATVRLESRLGALQANMGLYDAAAGHMTHALDAVAKFRARFPGKKWLAVRDSWLERGKKFNMNISEIGKQVSENPMQMLSDDTELTNAVAQVLREEQEGGVVPDDALKPPPRHADAEEIEFEWRTFIERQHRTLQEEDEHAAAGEVAKALAAAAGGFNRDVQTMYHEPPPSAVFLKVQADAINDILQDVGLDAVVTPAMIAERSHPDPGAAINPAESAQAGFFLGMMKTIQAPMFKAIEDGRNTMMKTFTPEETRVLEAALAAPPCQMQIASALQQIHRTLGNDRQAAAMHKLAWTLYDEQTAFNAKLTGGPPAANLLAERRAARDAGMPVPVVYTDACDGVLKQSKETMWDADAAAAAGHLDDALGRYESVAAVSPALRAAALTRAGALYEKRGDSAKAIGTYAKAIDAAEALQSNLRLDELVMSWAAQQKPLYAAMISLSFDHGHADSAFAYAERARARAFLNQLGNRRLPPAAVPKELASELYDVRRKLFDLETFRARPQEETAFRNPFGHGDEGRLHEEEATRKRFQQLLARVAQANPAYVSLVQVDTVPLKQLQREVLPADATLLEYFVLRDRVLVWVIDHQSVHSAALPIASANLRSLIMDLRELITDRDAGAQAIGGRLYDALIAPVAQHIRQPNLIIVPHGVLHYMPFPALWSASRNQYLVESYTITLASSASALRYAPKQRAGKGVLIFGNPDRSLPNAEAEANGIGSIYGTPAWIGKDARESRLRQDGARAGIVHIAAHARYESGRPLFTRIDLAPDDGAAAQSEGGDGRLHLYEVYDLDLSMTRLAVLSACETAMGPASEGDDLVALSRAFRYAGAASVVTTLWAIDDASTSALMNDFYHRLHDGVPAAEALRQSQLYLLRETRFREPYHWAAFTLTR